MARAQRGDDEAWGPLIRAHEPAIRARIRRLVNGRVQRRVSISDVLQQTLLVAHARVGDFEYRGRNSLRSWLLAIAENKARGAVEHHVDVNMRSIAREVTHGHRASTRRFQDGGPSPSAVVAARESEDVARRALAELSADDQEILRLCREEGLRFPEAAERMGRSYEATKKLYGRALTRFSTVLARMRRGQ